MTTTDEYKAALDTLNQYIWEHKLRHTAEREIILSVICGLEQPFTPAQVVEKANAENISQATVYNCINLFDKIGIISLLQKRATKSKAQWEVVSGKHNRLQLICKKCGRVADFKDIAITNAVKLRKYSNFVPEHFTIFVYGECKHCRKI
ncbi:MAG: transcriptional repressor [Paludibacteraceae bacterium]|nr:transcriptional repressor [Paludibacteraceae bacterium]